MLGSPIVYVHLPKRGAGERRRGPGGGEKKGAGGGRWKEERTITGDPTHMPGDFCSYIIIYQVREGNLEPLFLLIPL